MEHLRRLFEIYKRISELAEDVRIGVGADQIDLDYPVTDLWNLILDMLGVPADTWDDDKQEGFCRDWLVELELENKNLTFEKLLEETKEFRS